MSTILLKINNKALLISKVNVKWRIRKEIEQIIGKND